jgi:bifunctional DNA-binding transcriptional regulator/antitoxin component of YhaV-PrlF toxin-antitoxin module
MTTLVTASLSSKAQLTLPKRVRELLGVKAKGDQIGFLVDEKTQRVLITRMDLVPAQTPYTQTELRKLFKLAKARGGKTFDSAETFLKHVHSL